jgi:hypothetical protein
LCVPVDYTLEVQGITQSLMSSFLQCRQKFIYAINRMSHPKKIAVTNFGSIVHDVLAILYTVKKPTVTNIAARLQIYRQENAQDLTRIDAQVVERDFAVAEVVLTKYIAYYATDWAEMKDRQAEQEAEFFPLTDRKIIGRCKIDGRYRDKAGKKWLLETKTKGRISEEPLVKRLSFDPQNLFYLLADQRLTNEEAIGMLYNIIRNPQIKPKVNETLKQFCDRLAQDVNERPEFYFMRFEIPYTSSDKKRFEQHLREIILDIEKLTKGESAVYRNCYGCDSPYPCEYLDACASNSFAGYFQRERIFTELTDCEY